MRITTRRTPDEEGTALVAVLAVSLPMVLMIGAVSSTMTKQNQNLLASIDQERAFQTAESGIDAAIYRARVSLLAPDAPFSADIADGMRYTATPNHWLDDGIDNDGDGTIDESDEDVILVEVAGTYRGVTCNLSATFVAGAGVAPAQPFGVPSPLYFDPSDGIKLHLKGSTGYPGSDEVQVSGFDHNLDGTRPANPVDVPAITVVSEDAADSMKLKGTQFLDGVGLVDVRDTDLNINDLAKHVQTNADFNINGKFTKASVEAGNSAFDDYRLTYSTGKLNLKSSFTGAGIFVVDGDMKIDGEFRFDGLLIVRGKLEIKDESQINGAIIVRGREKDEKAHVKLGSGTRVQYSTEALNMAADALPGGILPRSGVVGGGGSATFMSWHANYARSGFTAQPHVAGDSANSDSDVGNPSTTTDPVTSTDPVTTSPPTIGGDTTKKSK